MSLTITKSGLLDTVQDIGRYGYQHLGVNPGGAMDNFSAALANALLGKPEQAPVIEMHYPAATITFEKVTAICITGGHFTPVINDIPLPLNQPIIVNHKSKLEFKQWKAGTLCYLAILHDLQLEKWLNSYSTNLKAEAGGWKGRSLKTGDVIQYKNNVKTFSFRGEHPFIKLSWKANIRTKVVSPVSFIKGAEWELLTAEAKKNFTTCTFLLSKNSDRMGYHLEGEELNVKTTAQLVSTGVCFGTVQLLPNGQLIILMADHQTTGGYPKVAYVISTHLPLLAQMRPGTSFTFKETDITAAEQKLFQQNKYLQQVKQACRFKIENITDATL